MNYTHHAIARKKERKVKGCNIMQAIDEGKMFYRQGMKFYIHPNNRLIVVTSNSDKPAIQEHVITMYRRSNAIKYIKLKPKRREKWKEQAKQRKCIRHINTLHHDVSQESMNAA